MKTMTIRGVKYVEVKPGNSPDPTVYGVCAQCVFGYRMDECSEAIDDAAYQAFGGDCMQRDVVYSAAAKESA